MLTSTRPSSSTRYQVATLTGWPSGRTTAITAGFGSTRRAMASSDKGAWGMGRGSWVGLAGRAMDGLRMLGTHPLGRVVLADEAEERDGAEHQRHHGEPEREPGSAGEICRQHQEDHVEEAVHDPDDLGD